MKSWNFISGSKTMNCLRNVLFLIMGFWLTSTIAEETEQEILPSIDFLEFLGEWETDNGVWIDPVELEDEEIAKLLDESDDHGNSEVYE